MSAFGLVGRDDPLLLAALEVQVDPAQPERIGPGPLPVDLAEQVAGGLARLDAVAQRQKAVVVQPGVQVNAAPEAVESVIGERDEQRLVVAELERLADDGVAAAVTVVDDPGEFGARGPRRGWPDGRARGTARTGAGFGRACRTGSRTSPRSNDSSSWSIIASRSRQAISHWSRNASSEIRSLFSPAWSSTMPVV